jgi:hypothetical protein
MFDNDCSLVKITVTPYWKCMEYASQEHTIAVLSKGGRSAKKFPQIANPLIGGLQ